MDFEEKVYEMVRRNADVERRRFIRKHGRVDQMERFYQNAYNEIYRDVTKSAIKGFNRRMNCGGYALKIDDCFFPNGDTLGGYVSSLLEQYDFIRLLGDKPLQEDEYLVFYRFFEYTKNKGRNYGHHFIRVDDDGLVVEKCGGETPRIFEGWDERFEDSPEVVFAVKKEHEGFIGEVEKSGCRRMEKGLDFEGSVFQAILKKSNQFEYHEHNFRLKKSSEDELFITDEKGEIVADVLVEGENIAVGIRAEKEEYVENYSGPVKPIIENGRLINLAAFKQQRENDDREL